MNTINIGNEISITDFYREDDKHALVKYLNEREITDNMLMIPFPYTLGNAEYWLGLQLKEKEEGKQNTWPIRFRDELIGAIGFKLTYGENSHKEEIAYWLAKPFWNKGIITKSIKAICKMRFEEKNLIRIEAIVFLENKKSARVLEKCNFLFEGKLSKFYKKEGKLIDGLIYAIVKE